MKNSGQYISNESGSVIVIVMVVLIAVSAMGLTLMNLGSSEQEMGANLQLAEQSFQSADSCLWVTGKFLHHLYDKDDRGDYSGISPGDPLAPGIVYPASVTAMGFHQKITRDPEETFFTNVSGTPEFLFVEDLGFDQNMLPALADIRPRPEEAQAGTSSNQQNAGYSAGVGLGGASGGGYSENYIIACQGRDSANGRAASTTYARYRKVAGISGGL